MVGACDYCGCDVSAHDPVRVVEDGAHGATFRFCNYGCLAAFVDREGLAEGTACVVDP